MNNLIFSILLVLIGLFVGIFAMIILNSIKTFAANKKSQKLIEDAKIKLIVSSHNYNLFNLLRIPINHIFFINKEFNEKNFSYSNTIKCITPSDVKKYISMKQLSLKNILREKN